MSKVMLVNVTHVEESRVATIENGLLQQYEIETASRAHLKGNIHNAVVENIHPALDAAFLRIGPDLKGFLPLDEVNFRLLPSRTDSRKNGRIGQHLHPGQKLMVQIVREPFAGKPPTVTTYFSLPGRYLVPAAAGLLGAVLDFVDAGSADAFEGLCAAIGRLPTPGKGSRVLTWPNVTILPFLADSSLFMVLKPGIARQTASRMGFDLPYAASPTWPCYDALMRMSARLRDELRPLGAADYVDVQAFMWVTRELE